MGTRIKGNGHKLRSLITRLVLGKDLAEMLQGYSPPVGKHNSLITGSPTSWTWGKGDHGSELDGLADDDHTQYLNNTRHDVTARHALGSVVPHDNLADLAEKAHASLSGIGTSDHHTKTGDYEVFANTEVVTSLPAAASGNVGRIMRERAAAGQVTQAFMCVQNSSNAYEWIQVGIST